MGSEIRGTEYQVFLSFRGPDTRQGFADFLYHALVDAGVRVFRDDDEIRPGEKIQEILRAIDNSTVCIPIFSKGYADSKWCLWELAEMMEKEKKIMPVFYDVTPDDVKLRTKLYTNALIRHEKEKDKKKWERVLKEVVEVSGWDSSNLQEENALEEVTKSEQSEVRSTERDNGIHEKEDDKEKWASSNNKESDALKKVTKIKGWEVGRTGHGQLCKLIVEEVLKDLKVKERIVSGNLVGMDKQVEAMLKYLNVQAPGVRYVAIHGIGGCGKTTLAETVFNSLIARFEAYSFLANIRESSKMGLENLQEKLIHDLLPKDSRVISDTNDGIKVLQNACQNKKVLIVLDDVDDKEQIKKLAGSSSWYSSGSRIIITTRDLRVIGVEHEESSEVGSGMKSRELWTYEMKEMSFDHALRLFSKRAFKMEYPPSNFLDLSKEVVSVVGRLPLALEIVGSQLYGKRKEVWEHNRSLLVMIPHKDIRQTLMTSYKALDFLTKQIFLDIACLPVNVDKEKAICMWRSCGFRPEMGMKELFSTSMVKETNNGKLWMHDHLRDLGKEIISMENLMDFGKRSRLWDHEEALDMLKRKEGMRNIEMLQLAISSDASLGDNGLTHDHFERLRNLRFLQMHGIKITGDFDNQFKKLRWLSWRSCPSEFTVYNLYLQKLAILDLSNSEVTENWEGWNKMKVGDGLKIIDLSSCGISRMPDLSRYRDLERLILYGCSKLTTLGNSIGNLKRLKHLNMELCSSLQGLPEEIGSLESLEELYLSRDSFSFRKITPLPESIGNLKSLVVLYLYRVRIGILPYTIGRLRSLRRLSLRLCWIERLPETFGDLHSLVELDLGQTYPALVMMNNRSRFLKLPASFGNAKSLSSLDISQTTIQELPESIGDLEGLKRLDMSNSKVRTLPPSIGRLRKLEELHAQSSSLEGELPTELGMLSSLRILNLSNTKISLLPSTISQLSSLTELKLEGCNNLQELPSPPANLTSLRVVSSGIRSIQKLSNMKNLTNMVIDCCIWNKYATTYFIMQMRMVFPGDVSWIWDPSESQNSLVFCSPNLKTLPEDLLGNIYQLHCLLLGCPDLQAIPPLPSTLSHLVLMNLHKDMELPCLSTLKYLSHLLFIRCSITEEGFKSLLVKEMDQLEMLALMWDTSEVENGLQLPGSLQVLQLYSCANIKRLWDLSPLKHLRELNIELCAALVELSGLELVTSLEKLCIIKCKSLASLGPHLPVNLRALYLSSCPCLENLPDLGEPEGIQELSFSLMPLKCLLLLPVESSKDLRKSSGSCRFMHLQELNIKNCIQLEEISGLGGLESLQTLTITYCHLLKDLGPQLPSSLRKLEILSCDCLTKFPDVSHLKNLHRFSMVSCSKITEIPGVEDLKKNKEINLWLP